MLVLIGSNVNVCGIPECFDSKLCDDGVVRYVRHIFSNESFRSITLNAVTVWADVVFIIVFEIYHPWIKECLFNFIPSRRNMKICIIIWITSFTETGYLRRIYFLDQSTKFKFKYKNQGTKRLNTYFLKQNEVIYNFTF